MDLEDIETADQWDAMVDVALRLEKAGYESAWVYDHFHTVPKPTQGPTYECWTLMAALAPVTETIRLGQMCTCNSYRPPSYMAKVASSVDVISGGRLEFAIGAGWYDHEYLAYGYEYPKPSVRIGQLDEAVQIIKKMWTEDEATFDGKYYSINGAVLAEHCEKVGRDFDEIGRTVHLVSMVDADDAAIERAAAQSDAPVDKFLGGPMTVAGSANEVANRLGEYAEAGCDYFIMYFPDAVWGDSIEAFASDVIPAMAQESAE
jgi:alkanesulfonate monooxygenase SsuD/methylene tetrahydromethanopterin reductase-like flavin-dependent oxidoreductase (luciferase family)